MPPREWLIVDNGSLDATGETASEIARELPFAKTIHLPALKSAAIRGAPIVAAFEAGVGALDPGAEIIVKLDADVSFEEDFFERIVRAFEADPSLGIAGGTCYEQDSAGEWRPTFATRDHVRGATRAYRAECFAAVTPLEPRMGWDGIDELKAQVAGWSTRTCPTCHSGTTAPSEPARGRGRSGSVRETWRTSWGTASATSSLRTGYRSLREPTATANGVGLPRRRRQAQGTAGRQRRPPAPS